MDDPNGWPDPSRPGVPMNSEVDGWHWLQNRKPNCAPHPVRWKAGEGWVWSAVPYFPTTDTAFRYHYLGPCLLPAEVAARIAEALEEAAEIAAHDQITEPDSAGRQYVIRHGDPEIADAIRALKDAGDDR